LKGVTRGTFKVTIRISRGGVRKTTKASIKIVGSPTENRTDYVPNTRPILNFYTNPLGYFVRSIPVVLYD